MFSRRDFGAVQARWDDFWAGRNDRPLYAVTIPKNGVGAPYPPYLMGFDGNYQAVADMLARWVESCEFYGEAVPVYHLTFGADTFAALCGADLVMGQSGDTSWPVHTLHSLREAEIAFDKNGKWWNRLIEFHGMLKRALGDSLLLAAPTLSAGLDGIVGLYGAENLLTDMVDDPEAVLEALGQVNAAHSEAMAACMELFEIQTYGSATRHGMVSSGAAGVPQCDVSCMISSEMFEAFAMPCIRHEIELLDAVEYHLDGPGAIRHLERLAEIPKLRAVQWVAGAGEARERDWTPLYKHILALGKGLIRHGSKDAVVQMQRELRSKDIFYQVQGIRTRMEAECFLADMEKRWDA